MTFFVHGIPVGKGSGRAFYSAKKKKAFVIQDNDQRQKPWVSMVSMKAEETGLKPVQGPVAVILTFFMPRLKSHSNKKGLKPDAPVNHTSTPDIDKLERAVLDALTSIAWFDDKQVCDLHATKSYADIPGVQIEISFL